MCDHCLFSEPDPGTRRSFLKKVAATAAFAGLSGVTRAAAKADAPQAGHTGWARLVTPSPYWDIHNGHDPIMGDFIRRETTLKLDPVYYPVEPAKLDRLCAFPFIFTNNLAVVRNERELLNIREYLYRGGFIYIDGCVNAQVTPSFKVFYEQHMALFQRLLPGCEIRKLQSNHPIFRAYFPVNEHDLNTYFVGDRVPALYGVIDDDRMIMLLSLEALQCGWPQDPEKMKVDMKQIANIYVYALAH